MIDRLDNEISTVRTAMNLRAYRQEVLASNIANADTPHYKARDLDFASALKTAMSGQGSAGLDLNRTSKRHIRGETDGGAYGDSLKYRTEYQGAVDGNTVNMDVERAAFAENSLQYEAMITTLRSRFGDLRMAMQSQ